MSHFVPPTLPKVLVRALDAFRATDATSIGEAFDLNGYMVSQVDPKLLAKMGLDPMAPRKANGSLSIAQAFAHEFDMMTITHLEVHNELRVGREVAAMCDFEAKLEATGQTVAARCSGIYTLSRDGRRILNARTVCKLITPGWDFTFN